MIAHGRWLRRHHGEDACVVFIGPCIAKKEEILDKAVSNVMDAALTFENCGSGWRLKTFGARKETAGRRDDRSNARLFPVEGGLVARRRWIPTGSPSDRDSLGDRGLHGCLRAIRAGKLRPAWWSSMPAKGVASTARHEEAGERLSCQAAGDRIRLGLSAEDSPSPFRMAFLVRTYADKKVPQPAFRSADTGGPRTRREVCP